MTEEDESALHIDGERITMESLTFREQRELRDVIKQLAPDGDAEQAMEADIVPALIFIVKKRTDAEFTLEQALDFKPEDLSGPPTKPAKAKAK